MVIERISADNPLQPRHAGMMAVLRNGSVHGPLSAFGRFWEVRPFGASWLRSGQMQSFKLAPTDIVAVLPMPDISGVK